MFYGSVRFKTRFPQRFLAHVGKLLFGHGHPNEEGAMINNTHNCCEHQHIENLHAAEGSWLTQVVGIVQWHESNGCTIGRPFLTCSLHVPTAAAAEIFVLEPFRRLHR